MDYIPYGAQRVDDDDIAEVEKTLRSDFLTCGPKVEEFEAELCRATGSRYAVAVSNGTAALHLAAISAGVGPGDEVLVPALTFAASANCALYCGAKPVFVDVDSDSLLMDLDNARARATPRTKAIIPVHYGGETCDMDAVDAFAKERGLSVIQDCAHALGSESNGKKPGAYDGWQTWSFHPVKTITTGEGGAVTTNDGASRERLARLRAHGVTRDAELFGADGAGSGAWRYDALELGYNYRLSDIHCALGVSQLRKLPAFAARRAEIVARYDAAFRGSALKTQLSPPASFPVRHLYTVRLPQKSRRREVFDRLRAAGIGVNVHYIPVYWLSLYARMGYERGLCPNAEDAYERMITLPLHPRLTDAQVDYVIGRVLEAV